LRIKGNVTFSDEAAALRVLLEMSHPVETEPEGKIGFVWRRGKDWNSQAILMR
jgi:hypothetical protein